MKYVQPIRDAGQLKDLEQYILENKEYKYYVMFMLGIYSALRVSDILELRVRDVRVNGKIVDVVKITEQKTGKTHLFPIKGRLTTLLKNYCANMNDYDYLIPNERTHRAIGRVQAWRVINECAAKVGIEDNIGTHSMRKTYGYHFYQQTKDIVYLQKIFGHSDQAVTLRYIGVDEDTVLDKMRKFDYKF